VETGAISTASPGRESSSNSHTPFSHFVDANNLLASGGKGEAAKDWMPPGGQKRAARWCAVAKKRDSPGTPLLLPRYFSGGRHRTPAVPVKAMRCDARMALITMSLD
jgi:hypothetical protein